MKYILMDLDGTITNPKVGITKSVQYALRAMGILIEDLELLVKHIGPPLKSSFMEFYGFTETQALQAVEYYREYFSVTGIYENEEYQGMRELLTKLQRDGKTLIVATSKPENFARLIIKNFGLESFFTDICGGTLDDSRNEKEKVIRYALEKNHIAELSEVVMVGDRMHDVIGAKKVGIPCVGVLYGFGNRQELQEAGADYIAASVEELYEVIGGLCL